MVGQLEPSRCSWNADTMSVMPFTIAQLPAERVTGNIYSFRLS